jgi:hypothetical protein
VKLAERPLDRAGVEPDPLSGLAPGMRRPEPVATVPLGLSVRALDRGGRLPIPDSVHGVWSRAWIRPGPPSRRSAAGW